MQNEEEVVRLARVRNILNVLSLLCSHLKIYPQGNQVVRVTLSRLMLQLEKYFAGKDHLDLVVARHGFLCDDLLIDRSNVLLQNFASLIFMHGVAVIKLRSGVSEFEIITFLRLIGNKPAESWAEGGVRSCLEVRRIDNIEVVELSEKDFLLRDEGLAAPLRGEGGDPSDLWDRFALGVFQRQDDGSGVAPAELAPEELARATSAFLVGQESEVQQRFMREASTFLVSLQHENIRSYRVKALEKLTSYVNNLPPHLKRLFLQNVFNYNLKADFAEDFLSALSDDLIMDALTTAAKGKNYVPPVVLNLLGKLARSRELLPADSPLLSEKKEGELELKTRELFRSDEFEEYVPEKYRHALLQILRSEELDGGFNEKLSRLKATLEEEQIEEHTGAIIVHILSHDADERHLSGLFNHLEKILELYAEAGDYLAIDDIRARCIEQGGTFRQSLLQIIENRSYLERILDGASRFGKEKYESLGNLITAVGTTFVDPILDRLAEEKNRSIRYFFIQCLKGMGPVVADRAVQRLRDPRWYYLRNLLALLREVGDPATAGLIRPLFRHSHPKVRHEALKAGLALKDAQAQNLLLDQLASRESMIVVAAIALARSYPEPRIFAGLAALLEKNELFDYRLELKRGVAAALIEIDQRQALPVLQRFAAGYNLFHPIHHAELCRDIRGMLEEFVSPRITPEIPPRIRKGGHDV
jgi:hypothetical protein